MGLRPPTASMKVDGGDVVGWFIHFDNICRVIGTTGDAKLIALLSVSTAGATTGWVRTMGDGRARKKAMARGKEKKKKKIYG